VLYVSGTRGRRGNFLYVDTHYDPDPQTGHDSATQPQTVREVLAGVLANEGADISAHQAIRRAHEQAESVATLAPEYQTISASAEASRWEKLFARSGLTSSQVGAIRSSQAYGPLTTALRDAEARGLNVDRAFPVLSRGRALVNANDVASVLHSRVDRWVERASALGSGRENLVVGLFPRSSGVTDPDMSRGLTEREEAIEQRAGALAEKAAAKLLPWIGGLGQPPADPTARRDWLRSAATVAAYRERWGIGTDPRPLGSPNAVTCMEQYGQRKRALAAAKRAIDLSRGPRSGAPGVYAATPTQNDRERGIDQ
jgi:hypothetical protein